MSRFVVRPVVAHLVREWLWPTESFIPNQITSITSFHAVVDCVVKKDVRFYPYPGGHVVLDRLAGPRRLEARALYAGRVCSPSAARSLVGAIRDQNAQVIHVHYLVEASFFSPVLRKARLPVVVSAYGYDVSEFPGRYLGLGVKYLRRAFSRVDIVLAMSANMERDLIALGCPAEKVRVHYHGIDTRRFRFEDRAYEEHEPLEVLCVGRVEAGKGQHVLLAAADQLVRDGGPRIRLRFVGDGPDRERLEQYAARLSWGDDITFTGYLPHQAPRLVEEYKAADLFVLASRTTTSNEKEGIPGTLVEAMAAGLPIISTYHGGIPGVIKHETNGLLVPENDVRATARALSTVLTSVGARARLGRQAAIDATRLDVNDAARRLEGIYTPKFARAADRDI